MIPGARYLMMLDTRWSSCWWTVENGNFQLTVDPRSGDTSTPRPTDSVSDRATCTWTTLSNILGLFTFQRMRACQRCRRGYCLEKGCWCELPQNNEYNDFKLCPRGVNVLGLLRGLLVELSEQDREKPHMATGDEREGTVAGACPSGS